MKKLRISVIGTGHLGKIHTKLWKANENITLVGVYDLNSKTAKQVADEFSCPQFKSLDEVIANSDAVTISTPTTNHYRTARKMIENNIHCFIEKPITRSYNEAQQLLKLAAEHNVLIQVGHVERFNPALIALRNEKINPIFIEVHRLSQFKPRATDVSVITDLMIHDIDIMLWLVKSQIKRISANGVSVITNTPDIANARIEFANGTIANLTASRISNSPMRKIRIFQKNAYFSIDFANQSVDVFKIPDNNMDLSQFPLAINLGSIAEADNPKNIIYYKPEVPKLNAIEQEQKSFVQSILEKSPISVPAKDAAEAVRIANIIEHKVKKYQTQILK
ncbi:MAG TPA: Gfo/Idh/MocA family oxidoreductase [Candidatus Kapabacteria bacterium]|jgi:predicted dehydrogenase|nr:Gfo/Idh/MocA family oxidoreductase [Candidatus Kapabacteria bacterium]